MLLRIIILLLFCLISISSMQGQKWSELAEQGLELEEIEQELETYLKDKPAITQKQEWKQYNRWKILAEMAGYGEVDPINQFYDRWETAKRFKQEERNGARNNFGTWESVTPDSMFTNNGTPNYGVIQDIEFDRLDNSILYVGTHGNGLLRRKADGSWDDLTFGLPIQGVSGIVAEGNRITILTGSKRKDIFRYHGLFISEDYGATWELRDIFEHLAASIPIARATYGLRVHPLNFNIQYALTGFGVYFTDDAWQSYSTHSNTNPVFELVFNPLNYGEIYYSSDRWVRKADFDFQNGTTIYPKL